MKTNKKITTWYVCIVLGIIFIMFIIMVIGSLTNDIDHKTFKIFSDIAEFEEVIKANNFEELPAGKDKYIKELVYTEKAEHKIKADKKTYEIFAYVFADDDGAREYFKNATGQKKDKKSSFSLSGNFYFNTKLIIYQNNKAYLVKGRSYWTFKKFVELLNSELQEPLEL